MFSFRKKAVFNVVGSPGGVGGRAQSNQKFKDINGMKILSIPATPGSRTRKGKARKKETAPKACSTLLSLIIDRDRVTELEPWGSAF